MSSGVFVFDLFLCLFLSAGLLYWYGNWFRQRVAVTIAVLVAWYFSFLIIFILPLDVSNTAYRQCVKNNTAQITVSSTFSPVSTVSYPTIITEKEINRTRSAANDSATTPATTAKSNVPVVNEDCDVPYSRINDDVLLNLWRVVYWSSQLLTWLILPLMQSFTQAGEFTTSGKLKSAIWDNAIYYASYLFIALILLIYIALQPELRLNWDKVKAIAAAASNTWGLFVLVLMLGYGLIEVPRTCWKSSQRGYQLNRAYFKVAKLMTERSDAEEALDDALVTLNTVSEMIGQIDIRRPFVDTVLSKVPLEMMEKVKRRRVEAPFDDDAPTEKSLVRLHRKVIQALQTHHRTEAQWADTTHKVFELEDINRNMISNEHVFKHTLSRSPTPILARTIYSPTVEWYWKCLLSPILLRAAAGIAAVMSALIIWSEVTFFSIHPPLSLFAVFVGLARENYNYVAIESICFLTICYLSFCTYYTIFKIRFLNYYYLARNHQSDEYTLLFSGALLCRLTPPLCLNFLSLIHLDSHVIKEGGISETAYTQVMGHMDVIHLVSDYFNIYFPIALLGLTLATYFSLGARVLSLIGFQQFLDQESEVTQELVEEGKEHIKREKRRIQRLQESATRRREFNDRMSEVESGAGNYDGPRFRQSDIVKNRNNPLNPSTNTGSITSPERSLLGDLNSPTGTMTTYASSQRLEMTSPSEGQGELYPAGRRIDSEPPRNIFDDL